MACFGNEERVNRYLDGALSLAEQARFEEHLAACPACQRELAQTRALFALLAGLQAASVPVGFREGVLAGLPRRATSPLGRWVLVAQIAAALILLTLAFPTLASWYGRIDAWFAPGWLSGRVAEAAAWTQTAGAWLRSTLAVDVELAWPQGFGLTWPQAAMLALALAGLWWLGNRLLLAAQPNGRRKTT